MARSRFFGLAVVSLVLTFTFAHTVWAEGQKSKKAKLSANTATATPVSGPKSSANQPLCKVYSLDDLGDDPSLCKWVADTIPEVVQPGSWTQRTSGFSGGNVLTYYAPSKILVVYHTPEVQTQVEAFLSNLKKAMPAEKQGITNTYRPSSVHDQALVPAKYSTPSSIKTVEPVTLPAASSYPVPNQCKQPKHLFHFIIRYEGEGIVDDTVSGLLKDVYGKAKEDKAKEESESKTKEESDSKTKEDSDSKSEKISKPSTLPS